MNSIPNREPSQVHAKDTPRGDASPALSPTVSPLPGPLGLLKSPLFYAVTVAVVMVAAAAGLAMRSVLPGVLAGVALELLSVIIIWQYLLLSSRLENMAHRVADLYRQGENTGAEVQSSRAAHGYTHRLLTELSSDQSRSLQSTEELKKVSGLFYEQLVRLSEEARTGRTEVRDFLESAVLANTMESLRELQELLAAVEAELPRLTDQSELRRSLAAIEAELPRLTDQSELRKSLAAIKAELPGLTDQSELRKSLTAVEAQLESIAAREGNAKQALEVATALDRLNLEVRKQLAKLRLELGMS